MQIDGSILIGDEMSEKALREPAGTSKTIKESLNYSIGG
jgi:hypothetical protein